MPVAAREELQTKAGGCQLDPLKRREGRRLDGRCEEPQVHQVLKITMNADEVASPCDLCHFLRAKFDWARRKPLDTRDKFASLGACRGKDADVRRRKLAEQSDERDVRIVSPAERAGRRQKARPQLLIRLCAVPGTVLKHTGKKACRRPHFVCIRPEREQPFRFQRNLNCACNSKVTKAFTKQVFDFVTGSRS